MSAPARVMMIGPMRVHRTRGRVVAVDATKRTAELVIEARHAAAQARGWWTSLVLERCAAFLEKQAKVIEASLELADCADHASNCCAAWCDECRVGIRARDLYEVALEALERGPNGRD
jgi:hypothetical protein